jgi:hypothetical protein
MRIMAGNMKKAVITAICTLLAACASAPPVRVDLGMGSAHAWANDDRDWVGRSPAVILRIRSDFTKHTGCEYSHTSNLIDGPPFNDRAESSLDFIGCTVFWDSEQ